MEGVVFGVGVDEVVPFDLGSDPQAPPDPHAAAAAAAAAAELDREDAARAQLGLPPLGKRNRRPSA